MSTTLHQGLAGPLNLCITISDQLRHIALPSHSFTSHDAHVKEGSRRSSTKFVYFLSNPLMMIKLWFKRSAYLIGVRISWSQYSYTLKESGLVTLGSHID